MYNSVSLVLLSFSPEVTALIRTCALLIMDERTMMMYPHIKRHSNHMLDTVSVLMDIINWPPAVGRTRWETWSSQMESVCKSVTDRLQTRHQRRFPAVKSTSASTKRFANNIRGTFQGKDKLAESGGECPQLLSVILGLIVRSLRWQDSGSFPHLSPDHVFSQFNRTRSLSLSPASAMWCLSETWLDAVGYIAFFRYL